MKSNMRLLKLTGVLLFLVILCTTCDKPGGAINPLYMYNLYLSVQDASGTDLLKEVDWKSHQSDLSEEENRENSGKNKQLYELEIIFPEWIPGASVSSETFKPGITSDGDGYSLQIGEYGSYFGVDGLFMEFYPKMTFIDFLPADVIIYKLSFPTLFGDTEQHEIVSYWEEAKTHEGHRICYRLEFDGKECEQIIYEDSSSISFATVVLDR